MTTFLKPTLTLTAALLFIGCASGSYRNANTTSNTTLGNRQPASEDHIKILCDAMVRETKQKDGVLELVAMINGTDFSSSLFLTGGIKCASNGQFTPVLSLNTLKGEKYEITLDKAEMYLQEAPQVYGSKNNAVSTQKMDLYMSGTVSLSGKVRTVTVAERFIFRLDPVTGKPKFQRDHFSGTANLNKDFEGLLKLVARKAKLNKTAPKTQAEADAYVRAELAKFGITNSGGTMTLEPITQEEKDAGLTSKMVLIADVDPNFQSSPAMTLGFEMNARPMNICLRGTKEFTYKGDGYELQCHESKITKDDFQSILKEAAQIFTRVPESATWRSKLDEDMKF